MDILLNLLIAVSCIGSVIFFLRKQQKQINTTLSNYWPSPSPDKPTQHVEAVLAQKNHAEVVRQVLGQHPTESMIFYREEFVKNLQRRNSVPLKPLEKPALLQTGKHKAIQLERNTQY